MDVIFDVDGTLADCEHRRHFIAKANGKRDWKAFLDPLNVALDKPIWPIITVARRLANTGSRIIYATGRTVSLQQTTFDWFDVHGLPTGKLYMRPDNDYRPDEALKLEMLEQMRAEGFKPELVFDDRSKVVAMWRAQGLICAQVAEAKF